MAGKSGSKSNVIKIAVIGGVLVAIAGAIYLFSGSGTEPTPVQTVQQDSGRRRGRPKSEEAKPEERERPDRTVSRTRDTSSVRRDTPPEDSKRRQGRKPKKKRERPQRKPAGLIID